MRNTKICALTVSYRRFEHVFAFFVSFNTFVRSFFAVCDITVETAIWEIYVRAQSIKSVIFLDKSVIVHFRPEKLSGALASGGLPPEKKNIENPENNGKQKSLQLLSLDGTFLRKTRYFRSNFPAQVQ